MSGGIFAQNGIDTSALGGTSLDATSPTHERAAAGFDGDGAAGDAPAVGMVACRAGTAPPCAPGTSGIRCARSSSERRGARRTSDTSPRCRRTFRETPARVRFAARRFSKDVVAEAERATRQLRRAARGARDHGAPAGSGRSGRRREDARLGARARPRERVSARRAARDRRRDHRGADGAARAFFEYRAYRSLMAEYFRRRCALDGRSEAADGGPALRRNPGGGDVRLRAGAAAHRDRARVRRCVVRAVRARHLLAARPREQSVRRRLAAAPPRLGFSRPQDPVPRDPSGAHRHDARARSSRHRARESRAPVHRRRLGAVRQETAGASSRRRCPCGRAAAHAT